MKYVHWGKKKIYIGFLVLGMVGVGMVIGVPPAKDAKKSVLSSFRIPPLPTPPVPLPIDGASNQETDTLAGVTTATLLASVALFIESRSIELLVEQLKGITPQAAYDFVAELIKRPRAMDADEVIQVTYGILTSFMRDKEQRDQAYRILDLVHSSPQLQERHPPLLVIAAHSSYPHVIALIIHWARSRHILDTCIKDALVVIARTFDIPMLKRLEQYGVIITPERATYVLWHAVQVSPGAHFEDNDERIAQADAKRAFIDFLITKKANVNYHQDGYTVLMQATKHNDVATIEQLSRNGSDVNRIVDDAAGSALQIAIINDFVDAELVLRQHHALE
jgi:hypothetical protein